MDTRPPDRRSDLLRRICDLLPSEDSRFIASLDPSDYQTYVHAYLAVRRHQVPVDADLNARIVEILFEFHDAQAAAADAQRGLLARVPARRETVPRLPREPRR